MGQAQRSPDTGRDDLDFCVIEALAVLELLEAVRAGWHLCLSPSLLILLLSIIYNHIDLLIIQLT